MVRVFSGIVPVSIVFVSSEYMDVYFTYSMRAFVFVIANCMCIYWNYHYKVFYRKWPNVYI